MNRKGQMLIEVVISVGVLALVLIGVSDLMTRTQRVSSFQAKREEANSIAKSILNDYRIQRDLNPDEFTSSVTGLNRETCIDGKDFSCNAVTEVVNNDVNITIKVSWVEGENTFTVELNQKLSEI